MQLSYKLEDDYGVTEARAPIRGAASADAGKDAEQGRQQAAQPRPLFEAPQFALVLPNARTRNGVGQTVKDLSEDPYAGADVTLTLTAKDEAGNEGKSEPFNMRLPERLFTKPLARALIEQRRILALDANQNGQVYAALDALMIAPEMFTPETGYYLGLHSVARQLEAARTDDQLREVVASLWALAVTIEDGNISDVDKALRAAQDALKQALERGASDEEIKKLTDNLRAALDNFLRQLAEQFRNNPQQLARPLDPNTKVLEPAGPQEHARSHGADVALRRQGMPREQLLEQLQQMLENLQMAQPGQGGDGHGAGAERARRHDPQAAAIARQDLQAGPGFRRDRHARQAGRPERWATCSRISRALRDRLKKLQEELAKRGMGPGQRGQKGQQGQQGDQAQQGEQGRRPGANRATARTGSIRPIPRWAMPPAGSARAMPTARWIRKGARWTRCARARRASPKRCSRAMATSRATAPAIRAGRQQSGGNQTDPLGRPLHGREFGDDYTVKIPGEIDVQRVRRILEELRRRLADPSRPQIELDYIERLLKDY